MTLEENEFEKMTLEEFELRKKLENLKTDLFMEYLE